MPAQPARRLTPAVVLMGGCLVYLMLRPVSNGVVLYPVLGVFGLLSVLVFARGDSRTARPLLPVAGLVTATALLGLTVGLGNPGWINGLLTWGIAPVIFGLWAASMNATVLRAMLTASALATILLSLFILLYVGAQAGPLPQVIPAALLEETGAGFDGTGEATAIRLYGLSTLAAAAPMWVAALLVKSHPILPTRWVQVVAAVTATGAAYVGGRRAVVVIVVATPLIVVLLRSLIVRRRTGPIKIPIQAALAGVLAVPVLILTLPRLWTTAPVQEALGAVAQLFGGDGGVRTTQARMLLDGFAQSPIVGHGFGAVLNNGYYRSLERPWNFEMQYHLLAFQTGVAGLTMMALVAVLALAAMRKAAQTHPDMTPVLVVVGTAAIAMMIANIANPYLQAPGHMWAVFIALGAINATLTLHSSEADAPRIEQGVEQAV